MSKYFILAFIFIQSNSYSQEICFSKNDYKKYFFINGIKNTKIEAFESSKKIANKFELKKDINTIHNKSDGFFKDLKETFFLKNIEGKVISKEERINELIKNEDTYKNIKEYVEYLDKERQNYVFAHSEGNLFANYMCELKDKDLKLDVISFATPSDYLKCNVNKKFALFEEDTVIFAGNFNLPFLKKVKPNYKANISIIYKEPETNEYGLNLMSHSLSLYLIHEKVVSDLKQKLEKTESKIYEKDYSFHLAKIEIKEDGEFKKFLNNLEDTKDSVFLWSR